MKNEYKITKELMQSWAKKYHIHGKRNKISFVLWCLVGVCGLYLLVVYALGLADSRDIYFSILFLGLAVYRLFFMRFVAWSNRYKLMAKTYGVTEWVRTIEFLDDEIVLTDHTTTMKTAYTQITKIKEKGNMVLIFCNNDTAIRLYKDAFVEGSWEECKKLINSKISK